MLAYLIGAATALKILQLGLDPQACVLQLPGAFIDICAQQAKEESIKVSRIPEAVHVRLAEAE
jgi:hypothetical protein